MDSLPASPSNDTPDERFMRVALAEARRGLGFTSPNPMVGALIAREGEVLATGFHARDGGPHAEREALAKLPAGAARGATMYVTLEPCCHFGRTPPCTDALIEAGISRVVVANVDPDSRVAGQGVSRLRAAGIEVVTGVLAAEGERLNSIYLHFRRTGRPYVVLKAALTLDGRIAAASGDSKWISNEASRKVAHELRLRLKGIVVGRNTVLADRPRLSCRLPGFEHKPVDKLVLSRSLTETSPALEPLRASPGRVFVVGAEETRSPEAFCEFCRKRGIDSLLVEGGGGTHAWFLKNGLADRVILFYKPSFMGADGISVCGPLGFERVADLTEFALVEARALGNNLMVDLAKGEPLCLRDW